MGEVEPEERARLELAPEPASVGRARRFVASVLEGEVDDELLDAALVVTSELATNAMLHAQTDFTVVVRSDDTGLRLEVHDRSALLPHRKRYSSSSGTGRGLVLVEALATVAGTDETETGKIVWAVLTGSPSDLDFDATSDDGRAVEPVTVLPLVEHTAHRMPADELQVAADGSRELRGGLARTTRVLEPA